MPNLPPSSERALREVAPAIPAYRALVLAMLLLVYVFNFVDRQILGILAPAIKADLGLTDTQLGLLGGVAFALLNSVLGLPLAWVADRVGRTWVITVALAAWSGFTALCGLAAGFGQLFLCRVGVGVGEAGGVAPSYALIADYFPPRARGRALAVYALGSPLGSAAGVLLGGAIAAAVSWRAAFVVVGLAGLALAPVFRLAVREPMRAADALPPPPPSRVLALLAGRRAFWLLSLGAAAGSMIGYGLGFWLPSLFRRSFGLGPLETGQLYGGLLLAGGVLGVLAGGWIGDRLGGRDKGAYALVPAACYLLAAPLFAAGILASSPRAAFVLLLLPQALSLVWLGPVTAAVQQLVPPGVRATAGAAFLLVNNLIGLGLGTLLLGRLSDALTPWAGAEALRYAMLIGLACYPVAALLMWRAAAPLRREWVG